MSRFGCFLVFGLLLPSLIVAVKVQAEENTQLRVNSALTLLQDVEPPTLPDIIVTPDAGEGIPTVPPIDAEVPDDDIDFSDPLNPFQFDFEFEGGGSALRSNRTAWEDPHHVTVINREQLSRVAPRDMAEALEQTVGVLVQRTGAGQGSPFIRGLTGPQTLILVDGIRLNNSIFRSGPNQYFNTIDPGMVERIEVVRGPQSVLWGSDAIGGVINIVTRSAEGVGCCDYLGGEFIQRFSTQDDGSYSRFNIEGSFRNMGVFGGAGYSNFRDVERGEGLGAQPFTNYSQYGGDLKLDFLLDADSMLTFALQHFEQEDVPRTDKFPGESRLFSPQQRDLGYIRWTSAYVAPLVDALTVTGSYNRTKEGTLRRKPISSTTEDQSEFDVDTAGVNVVASTELDRLGRFTYGIDWYYDDVDAKSRRITLATGAPVLPNPTPPQFPDDSIYERFGTFLEWDYAFTDRLTAVSGVRYSYIDTSATVLFFDPNDFNGTPAVPTFTENDFSDVTSSIGLTYELNCCWRLVGSISEGFRAPGLDELTSVSTNTNNGIDLPNSNLDPESSLNYEVGLKWDNEVWRGQAFYYWTRLDDLIDRVVVGTATDGGETVNVNQRQNVGRADIHGLELAGEYLISDNWTAYGNYWFTEGENLTAGEPVSRIPPQQGVLGLRWEDTCHTRWVDLYTWIVDKQDKLSARDIGDSRIPDGGTPAYATLNLRMGREFHGNQRVTLLLENMTDVAYRVHGSGVDGAGFGATFGYERWW